MWRPLRVCLRQRQNGGTFSPATDHRSSSPSPSFSSDTQCLDFILTYGFILRITKRSSEHGRPPSRKDRRRASLHHSLPACHKYRDTIVPLASMCATPTVAPLKNGVEYFSPLLKAILPCLVHHSFVRLDIGEPVNSAFLSTLER